MRHYPHALFIVAVACASPKTDAAGPKPPNPPTGPLAGFWKSDGYGFVFAADADTLRAYEVTQKTCVVSFKASKLAQSRPGAESAYTADGDVFLVKAGPDAAVKRLHNDGAASDMVIRRIASLPPVCSPPTPDTPAGNFEVFAETWAEHYILFDQKKADWPAVVANARAKVSPDTKPAALFGMLSAMISPFDDAHTSIRATSINKSFGALRKGTDRVIKHRNEFVAKDMPGILRGTDRKLAGPLRRFCNDQVQYGHLNDSTGYLRLLSESNYVKDSGFAAGLTALEAALDTIFTDPKLKGLVIDVRINFGGADPYGLALAARLTTAAYLAYSKEARLDPVDRTKWTPGQPSLVQPSPRPGFRGPVVELIGPLTISAGETTTQALMGRMPKVLRIGENTQGVFSDVLGRKLPNGWSFGLPNEVFRASDGATFDGPGIPPDIAVAVFAARDLAAGRDPGLDRSLAELYRNR